MSTLCPSQCCATRAHLLVIANEDRAAHGGRPVLDPDVDVCLHGHNSRCRPKFVFPKQMVWRLLFLFRWWFRLLIV